MFKRVIASVFCVALVVSTSWAGSECRVTNIEKASGSQSVGTGVSEYEGVNPTMLFLGEKTSKGAQKCAHLVVIELITFGHNPTKMASMR
ncbi:MAG: hypothetical protein HC848_05895 [Limnobacter sp.]|nr:hypothetical protein [Limnobacter sp.]